MPVHASDRPLGVRADLSFSAEQLEMMHFLEAYDMWFVTERLERKGLVSAAHMAETVSEFRRYMALVGLGYRGLGMLSPEVDDVWHAFILFTREYAAFCQDAFGTFIHHVPRTSRAAVPEASRGNFLRAYAEVFGEPTALELSKESAAGAALSDEPAGCGTEDCTDG